MTQSPLVLQNITKSFGGKTAVEDVSFAVKPGEIIGFLGPNGAGKTTTLRIALGLIKPDSGSVELFGEAPGAGAFGRIGFLPEERGLYKKQTARESIAHMARLNGVRGKTAFKLADEMLDKYGLSEAKRKKNKDMSKGMAQKVQLLAAIAHDPEFYILDEPFSGLDPVNQQVLEDMVREIAERAARLFSPLMSWNMPSVFVIASFLWRAGRVVFDGPTGEALAKAPRRMIVASENAGLEALVTPFTKSVTRDKDDSLALVLKDDADTQKVLEKCVAKKIKLTRFEPKPPTLHEAFVAMVGDDLLAEMELEAEGAP